MTTAFLELTSWAADQVADPMIDTALDTDDGTGIEWRWLCDSDWTPLRSYTRLAGVIAARVTTHALQFQTMGQPVGSPWAQCAIVTDAGDAQFFLVELGAHGPASLPRVVCTPGTPGRERQVRAYPAEWSTTGTAPAVQAHLILPGTVAELLWDWMHGMLTPGFSTEPALPGRHRRHG
jgi:hypothetical protein